MPRVQIQRRQQPELYGLLAGEMTAVPVPVEQRYMQDPLLFAVDHLGVDRRTVEWSLFPEYDNHIWDGTPDPLVVMADALAEGSSVGVEGATGTGKTWWAACLVLWWLHCFENSLVVTTAPKADQLKLHLWAEISKLWPAFQSIRPGAQKLKVKLRMDPPHDYWLAVAFPVGVGAGEESAAKARGFHNPHMLIITEETPGIQPAVMTAFRQTAVAPHNLFLHLGNPDDQNDELHKACIRKGVVYVRISGYDYPNVVCKDPNIVPGATSQKWLNDYKAEVGEDSPLYLSRGRGICPAQGTNALIRMEWIRRAIALHDPDHPKHDKLREGPGALGVDVANSPSGDLGVIVRGVGAIVEEIEAKPCPNANELGAEAVALASLYTIAPANVGIDSVGVGAGAVNEARRQGWAIQDLGGGEGEVYMEGAEHFANFRSQMHWQLRKDMEAGKVGIPNDTKLKNDLLAARWTIRGGKIIVESKEAIIKRLGRSPDRGDAVVYWNWARQFVKSASGLTAKANL